MYLNNGIVAGDRTTQANDQWLDTLIREGILDPSTLGRMQGTNVTDPSPMSAFDQAFAGGIPNAEAAPAQSPDTSAPQEDLDTPSLPDAVAGLPPEKRPGFWQRMDERPGGREALLAFGANLLAEPNFFAGLGKGAMAYQKTLSAERDKYSPQLTKDQQFAYRRNPATGEYEFEETAAGARALQLAREKLQNAYERDDLKSGRSLEGTKYRVDKPIEYKINHELPSRERIAQIQADARIAAANVMGEYGITRDQIKADAAAGKPPSASTMKLITEHRSIAGKARNAIGQVQGVLQSMRNGTLELGLVRNLFAKGAQSSGMWSTEGTRAYGELQRVLQVLANAKLLDANGVQTDGDAIRAKIESMVSTGDTEGAMEELTRAVEALQLTYDMGMAIADDTEETMNISAPRSRAIASGSSSGNKGWGKARVKN